VAPCRSPDASPATSMIPGPSLPAGAAAPAVLDSLAGSRNGAALDGPRLMPRRPDPPPRPRTPCHRDRRSRRPAPARGPPPQPPRKPEAAGDVDLLGRRRVSPSEGTGARDPVPVERALVEHLDPEVREGAEHALEEAGVAEPAPAARDDRLAGRVATRLQQLL